MYFPLIIVSKKYTHLEPRLFLTIGLIIKYILNMHIKSPKMYLQIDTDAFYINVILEKTRHNEVRNKQM